MSPDPLEALARDLKEPASAKLAAYLALRPGRSASAESLARIIEGDAVRVQERLKAWSEEGLPLKLQGPVWAWESLAAALPELREGLEVLVENHRAKFEIQEILVFLQAEPGLRRPRA